MAAHGKSIGGIYPGGVVHAACHDTKVDVDRRKCEEWLTNAKGKNCKCRTTDIRQKELIILCLIQSTCFQLIRSA